MPAPTIDQIIEVLGRPTPKGEVQYLPKSVEKAGNGFTAIAIPYIKVDFARARLDDAATAMGWQSDCKSIGDLLVVGIAIRNPDTAEWIWRWDTGQDNGEVNRVIYSTSFKRAAYQWGIGKDLDALPKVRRPCAAADRNGKLQFRYWLTGNTQAPPAPPAVSGVTSIVRTVSPLPPERLITHNDFFGLARGELKMSEEEANSYLVEYTDEESGVVDWDAAHRSLKSKQED